jgi:hypothetical protein
MTAAVWTGLRAGELSKRVATARLRLRRLMPNSTAWRCLWLLGSTTYT